METGHSVCVPLSSPILIDRAEARRSVTWSVPWRMSRPEILRDLVCCVAHAVLLTLRLNYRIYRDYVVQFSRLSPRRVQNYRVAHVYTRNPTHMRAAMIRRRGLAHLDELEIALVCASI